MIWNDLPLNIRQSQSLASLKYRFKALPITQQLTDKLDKSGIVLWFIRAPFYVLLVFVACILSFGCSS